jgi:hypothetical protein
MADFMPAFLKGSCMRYLTPVLIVLLLISVIANGVMYLKYRSHRPILTVNATTLSKNDMDGYLEIIYGVDYKAIFTRRTLIHDAAIKAAVSPSDEEVNQKFQEAKQINWQYATTMNNNPWLADEGRKTLRENIELQRIQAKGIPYTDDDLRDEYKLQPAVYDTPSKAVAEVALLKNGIHNAEIIKLIGADPPVKPSAIMSSYRGEVRFLGDNNIYTFVQHFGTMEQGLVFTMKPGEVKQMPAPAEVKSAGFTTMVVRLNKIIPGHKAEWTDPKQPVNDQRQKDYKATQEALRMNVALKRANPAQELLRSLMQSAKLEAEDQADIENIKLKLLPPDDTNMMSAGKDKLK